MIGLGTLTGFVESAKGESWEDISDLALPIAVLYMIFAGISIFGVLNIPMLSNIINGVTSKLTPIVTMLPDWIGSKMVAWIFGIPIGAIVGVIELYFGAWLYKFFESIQESW